MEPLEDLAERAPMLRLVLDRAAPAMQELVRAESDLASFWLEIARDHIAGLRDHAAAGLDPRLAVGADHPGRVPAREHDAVSGRDAAADAGHGAMTTSLMSPRGEQLKDAA